MKPAPLEYVAASTAEEALAALARFDGNARLLHGVAGHAGVFSTGMDLARFAAVWLRSGMGPSGQWVQPATMGRFLVKGPRTGSRLLGWDTWSAAAAAAIAPLLLNVKDMLAPQAYLRITSIGIEDPIGYVIRPGKRPKLLSEDARPDCST